MILHIQAPKWRMIQLPKWIRAKPELISGSFEKEPFLDFHPRAFTPGICDEISMSLKINIHYLKIEKRKKVLHSVDRFKSYCSIKQNFIFLHMCMYVHFYAYYICTYKYT